MTKEELKVKVAKQQSIINDANNQICSDVKEYIICLHPLAFLNVYIEISALSQNHAEELKATYFQS
jgi:hypothetical protein